MFRKNNGFTLIECVVYMFLSMLIMIIGFKLLVTCTSVYFETVKKSLGLNSIDGSFLDIDRFLRDTGVQKISSEDNKIIIYRGDKSNIFEIQEILKFENNLIIKYYDIRNFNRYTTRNTIISNIDDFKVKIKGRLIYINISKGGTEYRKCL
ncbi:MULTISPECIES: prepilin-type N-terminal cleavage/methylation domain-containing protein [Clostridium]|uniref:Prepilin-type N-terminal cleavage/methylation domain-containing protein n=1 Tax=Clostridium cibarium TaxID=2762247 RepID=A0ABR8PPN0_9CLOT|nr:MULTISPECIES: prepilin-type N-terminal cleavage/methylation domain-containing protein [Clostridium]MBD7910029.1 prepilin-type N-terminal cleavage/methylation domain-containing protein [Clostridium cibarium]